MRKVKLGYRERVRDQIDHQIDLAIKLNYKSLKGFCRACGMSESEYDSFRKRKNGQKGLCLDDIVTVIIKTGWMKEELKV